MYKILKKSGCNLEGWEKLDGLESGVGRSRSLEVIYRRKVIREIIFGHNLKEVVLWRLFRNYLPNF